MLLTIDVGNTQTHVGAFDGPELVEHWRFSTDRQSTGDELAVMLHNLLGLRGIRFDQIHGEAVSSVVPRLVSEYRHMFDRYLEREALIVGPGTKTGMPILLENPHELGPDRLVNAVAGYDLCGDACVIVDFGTAINYDVVSSSGEYLGGIIAPGIEISIEALTSRAARLTKVDIARADRADRQVHRGRAPVGDRVRVRGPGGRDLQPPAAGARRARNHDRHRAGLQP